MIEKNSFWYVIRTRSGREIEVTDELIAEEIEAWCPKYRAKTKPTKKRKPVYVSRPLLPGYIFAKVPWNRWNWIKDVGGVLGWIESEDGPMPCLRAHEIDRIREKEHRGIYNHDGLDWLKSGDPLEILFGPFAGWCVTFKGVLDGEIDGEVDILGAKRRVKINTQHVRLSK